MSPRCLTKGPSEHLVAAKHGYTCQANSAYAHLTARPHDHSVDSIVLDIPAALLSSGTEGDRPGEDPSYAVRRERKPYSILSATHTAGIYPYLAHALS